MGASRVTAVGPVPQLVHHAVGNICWCFDVFSWSQGPARVLSVIWVGTMKLDWNPYGSWPYLPLGELFDPLLLMGSVKRLWDSRLWSCPHDWAGPKREAWWEDGSCWLAGYFCFMGLPMWCWHANFGWHSHQMEDEKIFITLIRLQTNTEVPLIYPLLEIFIGKLLYFTWTHEFYKVFSK